MSDRKGRGEALTGVLVDEVWSCEISRFRVPTLLEKRKATSMLTLTRVGIGPCAVRDLSMPVRTSRGTWEALWSPFGAG